MTHLYSITNGDKNNIDAWLNSPIQEFLMYVFYLRDVEKIKTKGGKEKS